VRPDAPEVVAAYLQKLTRDDGVAPYSNLLTFIEPRVQAPEGGVILCTLERLQAEPRMLLQGDPATGKTTVIKVVVYQLAHACMDSQSVACPIFVAASALQSPSDDPWTWLATAAARWVEGDQHTVDILTSVLKVGRAHLFVDGLDEIHEAHQRFRVAEILSALPDKSPGLKICVSTRPLDAESAALRGRFATWSLLPFDASQAQHLLSVLTASRWSDVEYQLANAPQLGSLTSNPLMLHLLAYYSDERGFKLPRSRVQLFEDLTDAMLARERKLVKQPIPTKVIHRGHELIAESMAKASVSTLSVSELDKALAHDVHGIFAAEDRSLFLYYAMERVGLLVGIASGRVSFAHRSFREFYLGRLLARDIAVIDSLPPGDLSEALSFAAGLAVDPVPVIKAAYRRQGIALAARCCNDLQQGQQMARQSLAELVLDDLGDDFRQPLLGILQSRFTSSENSTESAKLELFDQLREMWEAMPRKGATADARGCGLEQFAVNLFDSYFQVVDVRRRHQVGEVDVVCENTNSDPFWANYGGDIWVECKNAEAKATIEQVNTFVEKLVGSRWKLGFFFSVAGFTKDAMDRLKNAGTNPSVPLIVPISGRDIEEFLLYRTELQRFFKASIRRVA
jgi:hypothetical protein